MGRICAALTAALALVMTLTVTAGGLELDTPISARRWALADGDTGRILAEHNSGERALIASTTKLMTAYTAVGMMSDPEETTEVSAHAAAVEGSSLYLEAGQTITLRELLWGMLLESGNDGATALAEGCAGSEAVFVEEMNRQAQALGMADSHFDNPTGLDGDTHYSTAADLVKLAAAVRNCPELKEIVAQPDGGSVGHPQWVNHNRLLSLYPDCTGMKTGYTKTAGRTLVSTAERNGVTLICVTLDDPDDWNDHMALYEAGFAQYRTETLCRQGQVFGTVRESGKLVPVPVRARSAVSALLAEGETAEVTVSICPKGGGIVGCAEYTINGVPVGKTELLAQ